VHACEESAFIAAFFKLFFSFRLVYDMDDVISFRLRDSGFLRSAIVLSLARKIEIRTLRASDSVLTNSLNTPQYASRFKPKGVIFYDHIPNLPDAYASSSAAGRTPKTDIKTIIYAGNLEPYQGIDLLLESLALLFEQMPGRCIVIGGEQPQITAYKVKALKLGLSGKIEWTGKLDIEETFEKLVMADVLVSPMTQDKAVPSKVYLYMAACRPIVATDTSNHAYLLRDGSGIIVPPEPGAFAKGLLKVLKDPVLSQALSSKAYLAFQNILNGTNLSVHLKQAYNI
ncbi:MAG: glycosyltransferase, partial [bacterium]